MKNAERILEPAAVAFFEAANAMLGRADPGRIGREWEIMLPAERENWLIVAGQHGGKATRFAGRVWLDLPEVVRQSVTVAMRSASRRAAAILAS